MAKARDGANMEIIKLSDLKEALRKAVTQIDSLKGGFVRNTSYFSTWQRTAQALSLRVSTVCKWRVHERQAAGDICMVGKSIQTLNF